VQSFYTSETNMRRLMDSAGEARVDVGLAGIFRRCNVRDDVIDPGS
jgi:hypothetical protein